MSCVISHGIFSHSCSDTQSCLTFVTPQTVTCQAPLSMEFSRQEYWHGLQFPPVGDLPKPGLEPGSPASSALQADSLSLSHYFQLPLKATGVQNLFPPFYPKGSGLNKLPRFVPPSGEASFPFFLSASTNSAIGPFTSLGYTYYSYFSSSAHSFRYRSNEAKLHTFFFFLTWTFFLSFC